MRFVRNDIFICKFVKFSIFHIYICVRANACMCRLYHNAWICIYLHVYARSHGLTSDFSMHVTHANISIA